MSVKNKMKSKPTFQFSALDKSFYSRLQKAIRKLDGNYDTSKLYSSNSTHLIIDKIVCTEKILCFIAAGKWIITQSYIKNCLKESKFLDESTFQASYKFPNSKLAQISKKWKIAISQCSRNYPFYGWDVAIFIDNSEKAYALSRIIRAGHGNFAILGQTNRHNRSYSSRFTLVIYDNLSKQNAIEFANNFNIKYYPFQCIPDYLMQGIKGISPILSIDYYEHLSPSTNYLLNEKKEFKETTGNISNIKKNDQNLNKFIILSSRSNSSCKKTKYLNQIINDHFMNLWSNKAYFEAFFVISIAEVDVLPSISLMTELFEFLLSDSCSIKKDFKLKTNVFHTTDSIYNFLYFKVYSYVTWKILNFPSLSDERYKYFYEIFKNLILDFRIFEIKDKDIKGIIDVIYLICLHDFVIMNYKMIRKESLIHRLKLNDSKIFLRLIKILLNDKKQKDDAFNKILQILAFIDNYLGKVVLYRKIQKNYQKICSKEKNKEACLRYVFVSSMDE